MANVKWNNPDTGQKAQFIAETMKEALFDYSYDSNKVPSLNLHYFCQDYMMTFQNVEDSLMEKGNLIPLNEEFKHILTDSIWLPEGVTNQLLRFKNKNGYYEDISKGNNNEESKISSYYYDNAVYINELLESTADYCTQLLSKIETVLNDNSFDFAEKKLLYYCIREYLVELISLGVNKGHLYNQTQNKLFSSVHPNDDIDYIMVFLKSLLPKETEYKVVFGISDKVYFELKDVIKHFREATPSEEKQLQSQYVAENDFIAYDPVSALLIAKSTFSVWLSVYNSCMHETDCMILDNGLVKPKAKKKYCLIKDSHNLLKKNQNRKKPERKKWLKTIVARQITSNLFSSFELHNNALQMDSPQTQLLTLWTINEMLIDSNHSHMSRVNYITNTLCSVLVICYYRRKLEALYRQIILTEGTKTLLENEPRGSNHIEKLAFILKDNSTIKLKIINKLKKHPLNGYKIEWLSSVFQSKTQLETDVKRHSNRLRWQIMRIYRYRCMAVHDGNVDYQITCLNSTLENLHYYVDELFNFIFERREEGIYDIDSILTCARVRETKIYRMLSDKKTSLTDEEFYSIVFG